MKIILMMAITADGLIARDKNQNADWTTKADKKAFIHETQKHGCIIMGDTTYELIGKPLPKRLNFILTQTPEKYQDQEIPGLLEFFQGSPEEVISHLKNKGYQTAILGGGPYTNTSFLKAGLVDEILITIEPVIFGQGLTMLKENFDLKLELIETKSIGDSSVQVRYKVLK
jgi:dihydrofolate reductase